MKTHLIILLIIIMSGCSTPEKKAQQAVTNYLKENLNDWKSYEPIEWSYYDSSFSNYDDEFTILKSQLKLLQSKADLSLSLADLTAYKQQKDSVNNLSIFLDSARVNFKPSFNGYRIQHKFRAKNYQGNYIINERLFHVYKDYSGAKEITY